MDIKNRIVGHGEADPREITANPRNWREHPEEQVSALTGILAEVGWCQSVIVNRATGRLIDGHLRVRLAVDRGERTVPVVFVDLSEDEENTVLATLDPVALLAGRDEAAFRDLLEGLDPETAELQRFVHDLEEECGVVGPEDDGDEEEDEVLLDQAVQHEPGREYVLITCEQAGDWERLRSVLGLQLVRRGGYKEGSAFDATAVERVVPAKRLFAVLEAAGGGK